MWNLLHYSDTWCYYAGAENLALNKKRPALLRWNPLGAVSWESAHRSCIPEVTKLIPCNGRWAWYSVSHPGRTGFEGMKGSWRASEAWHCEKPLVEVQLPLQLKAQAWWGHTENLRLGTMKRAYKTLFMKMQPSCSSFGDSSTTEMTTKNNSSVEPARAQKTSCVCCSGWSRGTDPSLWMSPEDREWIQHWTLLFMHSGFCLVLTWLWLCLDSSLMKTIFSLILTFTGVHSWKSLDF